MKRALLLLLLLVAAPRALAVPVNAGEYTVVFHGIDTRHPHPMGGVDAQRSRRSRHRVPTSPPALAFRWAAPAGRVYVPAIDADGRLYVPTEQGLVGLGSDGRPAFLVGLDPLVTTPSLLPSGELAVAVGSGSLALVGRDGRLRARHTLGAPVLGSVLVLPDGSCVLATRDLRVSRFDPDGAVRFSVRVPGLVLGEIASLADGTLVVASADQVLEITQEGRVRASTSIAAGAAAGPAVGPDDAIWVATYVGEILRLDPHTRELVRAPLPLRPGQGGSIAVASDGSARLAIPGGPMLAFEPDGSTRFTVDRGGPFSGAVSVDADGVSVLTTLTGTVFAVGPDGVERWRFETGERTEGPPVLGPEGTIYVTSRSGAVTAWR